MAIDIRELKNWRGEAIAKLLLRKSSYNLNIDIFPNKLFDFFISIDDSPNYRFAAEIKLKSNFKNSITNQLKVIKKYESQDMINIPVLLIVINEEEETGKIDFLVEPKESILIIKENYDLVDLNKENLDNMIINIKNFWDKK